VPCLEEIRSPKYENMCPLIVKVSDVIAFFRGIWADRFILQFEPFYPCCSCKIFADTYTAMYFLGQYLLSFYWSFCRLLDHLTYVTSN
jgi:hypothetical protein